MIISGGVNIYPAEIEAVLYAHPQVLDVAVFGIPDDEWGESVYAIVQAEAGRDHRPRRARARSSTERVARYKRPRDYELRDELPRTDSGKLLKRVLRDEFWQDRDHARSERRSLRPTLVASRRSPKPRRSSCCAVRRARARRAHRRRRRTRAVAAADELGFPVVVKLCGDAIAHKTERGPRAARPARRRRGARRRDASCSRAARPDDGAVELLVAPMVRGHARADRRASHATRSSARA